MNEEMKTSLINEIKQALRDGMDMDKDASDEAVEELLTGIVFEKSRQQFLSIREKQELIRTVFNAVRRMDVLQPLIDDESITEIMVNGLRDVFVERNGKCLKADVYFDSQRRLEDVIQSIVARVNRIVNESTPIVDARLKDGSRVNAVLPPIALNGPILTIRKFPDKPITIGDLVAWGSLTKEAAGFLERLVKAKYNLFICGGTGSGKTTFLNMLSNFIPKDERIITIEDSAELQIVGIENIVRLETRNANTEGKGEVTIRDLIKTSLRMRPERIVVGEVRGAEALDMLQAMNTGHDGSLSTGHANSTRDMLGRLETMVLCAVPLPLEAIRQQIASAIDIIIHLSRLRDKSRRVMEITEVLDCCQGQIQVNTLYSFEEACETVDGGVTGCLKRTEKVMQNTGKFKLAGIPAEV